jgi:hypothetical protein
MDDTLTATTIGRKLSDLEDYLREQTRLALAVGHTTDARAFQHAMILTMQARELLRQT